MAVDLVGPIEVRHGDGVLRIAGARQQALVAMLALAAPHPVGDERLMDELWGDEQPGNPTNALQALVSQLRRQLGREAVGRVSQGYLLVVDPAEVDANRLDRCGRAGRAALEAGDLLAASAHFREGIALVRGPPLAELLDHPFARDAATRLEQLVVDAHEGLIDAELSLGHHADVVGSLAELVGAYPLRERFHAQLIIALYRCGRQADALRAYQGVRTTLLEELGIDPGPELRELERAVLAHDQALTPATSARPTASALRQPPTPLTSFVGRSAELTELEQTTASARLVTIVGPGGVGKSRVAIELASRLTDRGELCFVELAPVTDPVAVPETIADALGAHDLAVGDDVAWRPPEVRCAEHIAGRSLVLFVDNCEHVTETAARCIEGLLVSCPRLVVVATSREPLGIDGERQVQVGPLAEDDAAELFAARAVAVQPGFGGAGSDPDVGELCRRLDRLPLAIELAAARVKTLGLVEITERLDDRFTILRRTGRGASGRHDGLRAAIDWSYDLLFDDERRAFCRLSVFPGGATAEAAQWCCGDDAIDVVARLVDRSLVIADHSETTTRYRMLESLRAYGRERLVEAGELDAALEAHLQWCILRVEREEPLVKGAQQVQALREFDLGHDNARAALAWAVTGNPAGGLRLLGALALAWWFGGRRQEGRHWAEACLARGDDAPPAVLAKALAWAGFLADASGWTEQLGGLEQELALAEARQREAIALAEQLGDDTAVAWYGALLCTTQVRQGAAGLGYDFVEVRERLAAAETVFEATGDNFEMAIVQAIQAISDFAMGRFADAAARCDRLEVYAERCGDRYTMSRAAWVRGMLADIGGDPAAAFAHITQGVALLDELGMAQEVTAQTGLLGSLAERMGDPALATRWREVAADRGPGGARDDLIVNASARNSQGLHLRATGDLLEARAAHLHALAEYAEAGVAGGTAFTRSCLGFLAAETGDEPAAAAHHSAALAAAVTSDDDAALALAFEGTATSAADEPAARLLGAAARLWSVNSGGAGATHRADVAATAERLASALGTDAYARARAEGEALGRAATIALARSI